MRSSSLTLVFSAVLHASNGQSPCTCSLVSDDKHGVVISDGGICLRPFARPFLDVTCTCYIDDPSDGEAECSASQQGLRVQTKSADHVYYRCLFVNNDEDDPDD